MKGHFHNWTEENSEWNQKEPAVNWTEGLSSKAFLLITFHHSIVLTSGIPFLFAYPQI
jgi:hypothetical protein